MSKTKAQLYAEAADLVAPMIAGNMYFEVNDIGQLTITLGDSKQLINEEAIKKLQAWLEDKFGSHKDI